MAAFESEKSVGQLHSQDSKFPDVCVIIVSYNTRELTLKALSTLYETTLRTSMQVVVLDNASEDGSADAVERQYPNVELVRSSKNLGFGFGNNVAAKSVKCEWILLLNPDTECHPGAIDNLLAFAKQHPEASIFGGKTLFPDGSLNIASCWKKSSLWSLFCSAFGLTLLFPRSNLFNVEAMGGWLRDDAREVDIVSGCFFLTRKELWDELGGFDPTFFMYGEETDFCMRASKLGHKLMITPTAQIMHLVGAATGGSVNVRKTKLVYGAKVTIMQKHWSFAYRKIGKLLLRLGVINRALVYRAADLIWEKKFSDRAERWTAVWNERSDWENGFPEVKKS